MNALPNAVSLAADTGNFPIFEIDHPLCQARIALHGAQVLSWRPRGHEEVIYLSPMSHFTEGKAIRGGIPLCWPWFSAHGSDPAQPSHGIGRTRFWQLDACIENAGGVLFRFSTRWHDLEATAEIHCGDVLEVRVTSTNQGETQQLVGGALHSYFAVSKIGEIEVTGLDGALYADTLDAGAIKKHQGIIRIDREIDANFSSQETVEIIDHGMSRVITVEKQGCPTTVVWNPWIAKAKSMADLPDDSYHHFLCIEPAVVHGEMHNLEKGETCEIFTRISVWDLQS